MYICREERERVKETKLFDLVSHEYSSRSLHFSVGAVVVDRGVLFSVLRLCCDYQFAQPFEFSLIVSFYACI